MSRHLPLLLTGAFCLSFMALHGLASHRILTGFSTQETLEATTVDKPDFAAIHPVRKRKQAFFDFMHGYIEQRNTEILALRSRIDAEEFSPEEWLDLAKRYRIKSDDPAVIRQRLLIKVDTIPPALVMAQGAMESAWGTSRFAVEGNNYFGQWCFRPGCGLVPEARSDDKNHEVRLFPTPQASVNSYMRNLNSHPAYRDFRKARAELRAQNERLNSCYLAQGLVHYSEKGNHYVETLKTLIRVNHLERDPKGHCAPVMVAEEESAPEAALPTQATPQEIATDDTQNQSTPLPSAATPPAG